MARELNFSERAECALHAATAHNERAREVCAEVPLVPDQPTKRERVG